MKKVLMISLLIINSNTCLIHANNKLLYGSGVLTGLTLFSSGIYKNISHYEQVALGAVNGLKTFAEKLNKQCGSMKISLLDNEIEEREKVYIKKELKHHIVPTLMMVIGLALTKYSYDKFPSKKLTVTK
jgi:hypothetical protein